MTRQTLLRGLLCFASMLALTFSVQAEWKAANDDVAAAAKEPKIAAVLEAVNRMDAALVKDDHAAFASFLAGDLVVNNPQNGVSVRGATKGRNVSGLISYSSYVRSVEYAGMLGEFVLLMGDEQVVPKGDAPMADKPVRRRFTDIWMMENGRWLLKARQSTIVSQ